MPCELILSEKPAVVGPYARTSPGCLQCFKKVDDSYICPGTGAFIDDVTQKEGRGFPILDSMYESVSKVPILV